MFSYAVLPGLLSSVLAKLVEHVTKQCSVCQDTGEWCGAGILCEDSFSPIYPFQVLKKSFIKGKTWASDSQKIKNVRLILYMSGWKVIA